MKLRRFSEEGLNRMGDFLDTLTRNGPVLSPKELLIDEGSTELVRQEIDLDQRNFDNRYEVGKYLNAKFGDARIENLKRDRGIWAWLALFYFDQLCPTDGKMRCKPGERARWIPAISDFRKYYRHLLAGPFLIYRAYRKQPECAHVLLCTPPHSPGDIVEQIASRQEIVTNAAVVRVATSLYVDPETGRPKRGASGRGLGSVRRFVNVLNQFDITWDLYSMSSQRILGMLPREFKRFQ